MRQAWSDDHANVHRCLVKMVAFQQLLQLTLIHRGVTIEQVTVAGSTVGAELDESTSRAPAPTHMPKQVKRPRKMSFNELV